jgi:hypothetical protein
VRIGRRSALKGILAGSVSVSAALNAKPEREKKADYRIVELKPGYFVVDGWVVSKSELDALQGVENV